jgi:hypothetical protein
MIENIVWIVVKQNGVIAGVEIITKHLGNKEEGIWSV